jgi:hypothetical protein
MFKWCLPPEASSFSSHLKPYRLRQSLTLRWIGEYAHGMRAFVTNFMGHDLIVIVVQNLFIIASYGINTNVIHLLFEHQCYVHYLNTNVIWLWIILFKHKCCMSICVVYVRKSCTQFLCLNNAQYLCLNNSNLWNNKFRTNLEWIHETCKFMMFDLLMPTSVSLKTITTL